MWKAVKYRNQQTTLWAHVSGLFFGSSKKYWVSKTSPFFILFLELKMMVEVFMMTPKRYSQWNGPFTTQCVGEILTTGSFTGLNFCHFISFLTCTLGRHVVFWSFVSYYVRETLPISYHPHDYDFPSFLNPHFQQPGGGVTSSNPKNLKSPCGQTSPPLPRQCVLSSGFRVPFRVSGASLGLSLEGLQSTAETMGLSSILASFHDDTSLGGGGWRTAFQNTPKLTHLYGDLLF